MKSKTPAKIAIVVGTRPNFIKVTQFDKEFHKFNGKFDFKLIHTGQHYDNNMSEVFFNQLMLKPPDLFLNVKGKSPSQQIGEIVIKLDEFFGEWLPDFVIVVGDVNSTLAAAIVANKRKIRLGHLESGLRSFDREMPEEINRILTDEITDEFFVTEQSGLENLLLEGHNQNQIHFVGNTMIDTLVAFESSIQHSEILRDLEVDSGAFALMTMHRPRNVDTREQLMKLLLVIDKITSYVKLVFPIHPRTRNSLNVHGLYNRLETNPNVILAPPLGYLEFQKLIAESKFVVTDSGGIQEETSFRRVPCITLRPNTERPSTVHVGTNILMDFNPDEIGSQIDSIHQGTFKTGKIPPLWDGQATQRIVQILSKII